MSTHPEHGKGGNTRSLKRFNPQDTLQVRSGGSDSDGMGALLSDTGRVVA